MSRDEIQKLLGGYATDTLSEAERRALFEAALEDQELFDALAKEQALREVLEDQSARQQLIEALGPSREPLAVRAWHWLRQPAALAMAGGLATLLIVAGLVLRQAKHAVRPVAIMADAAVPRSEPSRVAPQSARPPGTPPRLFRTPATRVAKPSAPLPAPPALAASQPAAPPPAPRVALARGALADAAEAGRPMPQATQTPAQSFVAQGRLPMAAMARAKAAPSGAPVAARRAVEYTMLLKDAGGAYSPVPSGAVIHAGDSVRLQVEPGEAGYIYLFQRGSANAGWDLVTSRPVERAQRYVLPSTGGLQSGIPAQLELLLVLSRPEQPEFATSQNADADALASNARTSLKITLEFR